MENWDDLVARKRKQICEECAEELQKATSISEVAVALTRRTERLDKINKLCIVGDAVNLVMEVVDAISK